VVVGASEEARGWRGGGGAKKEMEEADAGDQGRLNEAANGIPLG
jgi:hypothetical protein